MSSTVGWRGRLRNELRNRRMAALTARIMMGPPPEAFARYGENTWLVPPVRVHNPHFMEIGSNTVIHEFSLLSAHPGPDPDVEPHLVIGDRVNLGAMATVACVGSVTIGNDVQTAARVFIGDASHAYEDPTRPVSHQGMRRHDPVVLGDGCFLGINTIVLPGVEIGKGAVVGAGAIVTADVPAYSVVVGAPARVVRALAEDGTWRRVRSDSNSGF